MSPVTPPQLFANPIVRLTLVPVFSALSLSTNYAMISIPNVKLMDALVFIAAFLFGVEIGIGTAIVSWGVYGFVNPYGQAGFPLILFLMAGECFYAIAGAVLKRTALARDLLKGISAYGTTSVVFGIVGLVATFAYDLVTNFATYLFLASSLYQALLIGVITGAPFAIVHELSNLFFFAVVAPGVIVASRGLTSARMGTSLCK
jgi:uncharacterized membrane protein